VNWSIFVRISHDKHIHFFISADNHRKLTTQINIEGDPLLNDDFAYATSDGWCRMSSSGRRHCFGLGWSRPSVGAALCVVLRRGRTIFM
jgi:hypothetical protein